ncbi:MAG: thiol-disulfide isomerase [Verrucomicrobiota bacterium]|jgi:thioredoxin 1
MTKNLILAVTAATAFAFPGCANKGVDKRVVITKEYFAAEVEKSAKPVLVEFWATWCGPCRAIDPHLKAISEENKEVTIAKLNVDDNQELAKKFNITGIPCMILFKDGKEVSRLVGGVPKAKIEEFIAKNK